MPEKDTTRQPPGTLGSLIVASSCQEGQSPPVKRLLNEAQGPGGVGYGNLGHDHTLELWTNAR